MTIHGYKSYNLIQFLIFLVYSYLNLSELLLLCDIQFINYKVRIQKENLVGNKRISKCRSPYRLSNKNKLHETPELQEKGMKYMNTKIL